MRNKKCSNSTCENTVKLDKTKPEQENAYCVDCHLITNMMWKICRDVSIKLNKAININWKYDQSTKESE